MKPTDRYTVMAQDTGSRNYAVAIVSGALRRGKLRCRVESTFLLEPLVRQLKDPTVFAKESRAYTLAVRKILANVKPTAIVFERYMTRGIKGATIEYISVMLGLLRSVTRLPLYAIPAVTWKTAVKKWGVDLESLYKATRTTPHQVDAAVMGIWLLAKLSGVTAVKIPHRKLLEVLETTSKSKLKTKRKGK